MKKADFLLIGGGIIGISIARELKKRYPTSSVCILEKESKCGLHASGRNSGVLHAGFYYTADSLKARFTRDGNKKLTEYCDAKNIKINKCGKLVVAQNQSELKWLDELMVLGVAVAPMQFKQSLVANFKGQVVVGVGGLTFAGASTEGC